MNQNAEDSNKGVFLYEGQKISYVISDNNSFAAEGKMSRGINYLSDGKNLGYRAVYDEEDIMQNITPEIAKRWYEEMKNGTL